MPKIRQEINLIDIAFTGSGDSLSLGVLNRHRFNGTVTAHLEIVGINSGSSVNANLRRDGTSTDDATIAFQSGAYIRSRSSGFTPQDGTTNYVVNLSASLNPGLACARIILLQDNPEIICTESQYEVGAHETSKTNTTAAPFNSAQYWLYDSSQYDGKVTFEASVTWNASGTMYQKRFDVEEDDGSFGNWTQLANIVLSSASGRQHSTTSFTPTSGRNYRITGSIANTMENYSVYGAKIIVTQVPSEDQVQATVGSTLLLYGGSGSNEAIAQSFIPSATATHSGVSIRFGKGGTPTDNLVVEIRQAHGGDLLATGTLTAGPLPVGEYFIPFTTPTQLNGGTTYYIEITRSGARDTSNYWNIVCNTSNPYSSGVAERNDSGTWTVLTSTDIVFRTHLAPLTKIRPEFLLANKSETSTGLRDRDTLWDPNEWTGAVNTAHHEHNAPTSGTHTSKLQQDPNGSPTDITNSSVTGTWRARSSAVTLPTSAQTMDVNLTAGTIYASRLVVLTTIPRKRPDPVRRSQRRFEPAILQ